MNAPVDRLLIGILRGFDRRAVEQIVPACRRAGLRRLEITMNSPGAVELIRVANELAGRSLRIGAGTVLNEPQLDEALSAGATFIVTPVVNEAVIRRCVAAGVAVFPGAYSPTEIVRAWELGATMVKVFPADQLGPAFIRNVKAPLPHIKLLPTGGVSLDTLPAFIRAGADGFGVGSPLFDPQRIATGDLAWLEQRCRDFVRAVSGDEQRFASR
jgi:2-dehydro-3-deoxyphosphogluconate aldolase/(4S)-4-hydroxy-2-oxoglutarate aldolase